MVRGLEIFMLDRLGRKILVSLYFDGAIALC
jgi:hypothetical protein